MVWAVQLIFQFHVIPWSKTFAQDCTHIKTTRTLQSNTWPFWALRSFPAASFQSTIGNNQLVVHLHNYFDYHVCASIRSFGVRCLSQNFFSLKSPWNHPLTPGIDPRGWPRVPPGHAAPPEELARARRALSSRYLFAKQFWLEIWNHAFFEKKVTFNRFLGVSLSIFTVFTY